MLSLRRECGFLQFKLNSLKKHWNPTRFVILSFGLIIFVGTVLLALPIASRDGQSAGFLTALFTATSATCVTGLILVDTWLHWTLFGQIVILIMIQLGGLGFMTAITLVMLATKRRISLSQQLLMVSTFNLNDMDGVVRVVRHALKGTLLFEGAGAIILSMCFVPQFGAAGIWRGVFHAVSAFCNAGFDLLGANGEFSSVISYNNHPIVLLTLALLVVIGGLGFLIWEDIWTNRKWKKLSHYTKMVLTGTFVLLLAGFLIVLLIEWKNPATLGPMPVWQKLVNALFQSVTLRTAGFDAIGQGTMEPVTKFFSILLMLVGGCSGSTAGGIKVGTVCVLLLAVRAGMAGRGEVTLRGRSIPPRRVFDAMTLVFVVAALFVGGTLTLAMVDGVPLLDAAFEVASAIGTVGLTTGITPNLSVVSSLIVIGLMFLGRVGILSVSVAFLTRKGGAAKIKYPTMDIMIG